MITTRDALNEAELSRSKDIANVVDEALAKFKSLKEFATLLKKDHDTGFEVGRPSSITFGRIIGTRIMFS